MGITQLKANPFGLFGHFTADKTLKLHIVRQNLVFNRQIVESCNEIATGFIGSALSFFIMSEAP